MNEPELADVVSRAEKFLAQGEPLLAYDAIGEGLTRSPDNIRLRQLQGLALARSGATQRANAILEKLRDERHADDDEPGAHRAFLVTSIAMPAAIPAIEATTSASR